MDEPLLNGHKFNNIEGKVTRIVPMYQQLNAQSNDVKLWCKTYINPIKFCCQSKKIILKKQTFVLFKFKIQLNVGLLAGYFVYN